MVIERELATVRPALADEGTATWIGRARNQETKIMKIFAAKKLIQDAIDSVAAGSKEVDFDRKVEDELNTQKIAIDPDPKIPGLTGRTLPDIHIFGIADEPGILLEFKLNGDWTNVGKACAQLWTYKATKHFPEGTILLAVFGSKLQHAHHAEMLHLLGMKFVESKHPFLPPSSTTRPRRRRSGAA
jgi:hypothetical protein